MTMSKSDYKCAQPWKRGKSKLVRISDQMNDLAWDLSEKNDKVNDAHTAKSIAMMDEVISIDATCGNIKFSRHRPRNAC